MMCAVVKNLGRPTTAAPAAVRARRPGWRDPRLWLGVAIVAICVIAGARLLAGADNTVAVWALRTDHAAGSVIGADDLIVQRVRFADEGSLGGYYRVTDPLPQRLSLVRDVGAGELLPRRAVGDGSGPRLARLPLSVDPTGVPAGLVPGTAVDVYVVGRPTVADGSSASPARRTAPVLADVSVVDVADDDLGGAITLTLGVPSAEVASYFAAVGRLTDPVVTVVGRP